MREFRATLLPEFEAALRRWVEPIVRPAGLEWIASHFGYHAEKGEVMALFEGDEKDFARRFPHVWPGPDDLADAVCLDLWIYHYPHRREIEATIEGPDVAQWLEEHGYADLAEALNAPADVEPAVRALADGLRVMLQPPGHR